MCRNDERFDPCGISRFRRPPSFVLDSEKACVKGESGCVEMGQLLKYRSFIQMVVICLTELVLRGEAALLHNDNG